MSKGSTVHLEHIPFNDAGDIGFHKELLKVDYTFGLYDLDVFNTKCILY
jgi:hypothetical protein